ncbi:hypothetical protein CW749_10805 [Vibrio sp. vnigr-6D03]|uniref:chalcone isomerase family protein n=1 Tax=Vibrio sp. vnigr-6D03 TaxID=2058088 RepID=UPI000C326792|nr:chalcone isomerase family protein [Vibrio sp. vnigr-6D03]PKF79471.1 hypothetical protein CW749_10805 [Vibrio sp. vnigr-6D03]
MNKYIGFLVLSLLIMANAQGSTPNSQDDQNWDGWKTVGKSSLSWLFFDIYKSELKTPSGVYEESTDVSPHPMALLINYMRDIPKQQLLDATQEQWEHLGYSEEQQQNWILTLSDILPDVSKGERLVYISDGEKGQFIFYDSANQTTHLGDITNEQLNDAFLSIWFSPDTEYPKHRRQLLGKIR